MTAEPIVQLAQRDHVVTITLRATRVTDALTEALEQVLQQVGDARDVAVVVLRGLAVSALTPADEIAAFDVDVGRRWTRVLALVERLGRLTLAVIDGTCTPAGLELALSCDHRLATEGSRFQVLAVRGGCLPGLKTFSLVELVGMGVARRLLLLGEPLAAQQALATGLVDRVCAPEETQAAIEAFVASLRALDPDVARLTRQLLSQAGSAQPSELVGLFLAAQRRCLARQLTSSDDESRLLASVPRLCGTDLYVDLQAALPWLRRIDAIVQGIDPRRTAGRETAAFALRREARALRTTFFAHHAAALYAQLSARPQRLDTLIYAAAEAFPGLLPTREHIAGLTGTPQKEKDDVEIDQASFIAELLSRPGIGDAVIDTMRTAKPLSLTHLPTFRASNRLDLGAAHLERRGNVAHLTIANRACLNAEDDALLEALEIGADVALLDPRIEACVLRGDVVENEKYRGRRVFCSGINLTALYGGGISYLYFVLRELGLVNKLYRGLRTGEGEIRKPWIMAVDAHAIGGGCQLLLVADYVIAEQGARFSVPAQHEGFIPGAANLRLARFVGPRLAREIIYMNRTLVADRAAPPGLADEVVAPEAMDEAIGSAAARLAGGSPAGFAGNQRMMRLGEEPDDVFRAYMASFARDQAHALFAPELIHNLEQHWLSR